MWTFEHRERYKPDGRRYPSDLSDAEWAAIAPLFSTYRPVLHDIREIVNGCFYLAAEGCRWRSVPKEFGPWQTVRGYWDRFQRDGIWAEAAARLTPQARRRLGKNAEPATAIVDSQSVPAGPQKGERGVDGNKKIKGIKRHVLTCSFGFVLAVFVTAASLHDTRGLAPLLERAVAAPRAGRFSGSRSTAFTSARPSRKPRPVTRSTSKSPNVIPAPRASSPCRSAGASRRRSEPCQTAIDG